MTNKQRQFCLEYLKDLNATQAAIRAGYSAKTADRIAHENLRKPEIQQAVQQAIKEREQRTLITADRVLKELAYVAFANESDYVDVDESGQVIIKPFDQMPHGASRAIKAIKEDRVIKESQDGTQITVHDKIQYQLHDKIKALELIGRHLAMWKDQLTVFDGDLERGDTKFLTDDELRRWIDGELTDDIIFKLIVNRKVEAGRASETRAATASDRTSITT